MIEAQLRQLVGEALRLNEPLASHTTFKIGGPAKYFVTFETSEVLQKVIAIASAEKTPWIILGEGSNVLVSDQGYDGIVIRLNNQKIEIKDLVVTADAGASLGAVVTAAYEAGLSGLEWAMGIPGTLGAAIRGNAGAYRGEIKDNLIDAIIVRGNEIMTVSNTDCQFRYRESLFKAEANNDIILSGRFQLVPGDQPMMRAKMDEIYAKRQAKFGSTVSAGSVFKNIEMTEAEIRQFKVEYPALPDEFVGYRKVPAAWLIEECGLKGKTIGGAQVYENHAAIINNTGTATAEDVVMLISVIKQKVRVTFNVQLQEEIQYVGF